jgi:hypothetical protein
VAPAGTGRATGTCLTQSDKSPLAGGQVYFLAFSLSGPDSTPDREVDQAGDAIARASNGSRAPLPEPRAGRRLVTFWCQHG